MRFDVSGVTSFGSATLQPTPEFENVVHLIDTLRVIKGRHTFRITERNRLQLRSEAFNRQIRFGLKLLF